MEDSRGSFENGNESVLIFEKVNESRMWELLRFVKNCRRIVAGFFWVFERRLKKDSAV